MAILAAALFSFNFFTPQTQADDSIGDTNVWLSDGGLTLKHGSDLAFTRQLRMAEQKAPAKNPNKWDVFADFSAGYDNYGKGRFGDLDLGAFNVITGVDRLFDLGCGNLTVGGFFEYGLGYNSISWSGSSLVIKSEFTSQNFGGGLFAHYNSPDVGPGHFYADVNGRMGGATNDYYLNLTADNINLNLSKYYSTRFYFGTDFALGYVFNATEKLSVNVYGRGAFLHLGDDSGNIYSSLDGEEHAHYTSNR